MGAKPMLSGDPATRPRCRSISATCACSPPARYSSAPPSRSTNDVLSAGARPAPIDYRALVRELVADGPARAAARAFAALHRDFSHEQQTLDLVDAIEATVASRARS